jgi:glycosyltransferase involved in cell wall biosynthesis
MNILSISGILPIPGILSGNDFVFHTWNHYRNLYREDNVVIIRPTQYKTNLKQILNRSTEYKKLKGIRSHIINNIRTEIFPFYSARRFRNLHAILSFSIYLLNRKKIHALIMEQKFDVIHCQYIFPDGLLAYMIKKRYRIPYVITTHNELFYFKHFISRAVAHKIMQNASGIMPINFQSFTYFKSCGYSKTRLIPLGFNETFLRKQNNQESDVVRIVSVAELIRLKNIDKVILAIKELVPRYKIMYTIIGKGAEAIRLRKMVDRLHLNSFVTFIEYVPHNEIADEMYRHDIFIMPSYVETFGRVYFEAMAMGIPVICAKNSGIFGYFKEMEEGISVNHNRIKEISEAMEYLITHKEERKQIGILGKKLVEKYTWDNIIRELHTIYISAIEESQTQ